MTYEKLAGKFEWTESGLVLLSNIQKEITKSGGEENFINIIIEENRIRKQTEIKNL